MFIGEKEIKSVKDGLIEFKDGSKQFYSKEYAEYFISKKPKKIDDFDLYKTHKIISDIMKLFVEANVTMNEMMKINKGVDDSVEHAKDIAISKLMGVEFPGDINFKTINDVVLAKK